MPGFLLHVGATVLCAHGGQAQPTAPNPRVLVGGQPSVVMTAPYAVAGCPFAPGGVPTPCVTAQWMTAATRVDQQRPAGAAPGQPGGVRAERHAAHGRHDPGAGDGGVVATPLESARVNIDFPFQIDGSRRTATTGDDDARARSHRAAALHGTRRAREPTGVRQRPAPDGLHAEQPGVGGGRSVPRARGAPAVPGRRDPGVVGPGRRGGLDAAGPGRLRRDANPAARHRAVPRRGVGDHSVRLPRPEAPRPRRRRDRRQRPAVPERHRLPGSLGRGPPDARGALHPTLPGQAGGVPAGPRLTPGNFRIEGGVRDRRRARRDASPGPRATSSRSRPTGPETSRPTRFGS